MRPSSLMQMLTYLVTQVDCKTGKLLVVIAHFPFQLPLKSSDPHLIEEIERELRAPHRERLTASRAQADRRLIVDRITVGVVLPTDASARIQSSEQLPTFRDAPRS